MTAQATLVRNRHEYRQNAVAALAGGDIVQLANGRAAVHTALKAAAAGDMVNLVDEGQFTLPKATGWVGLDGQEVFWDHSAGNVTYLPAGDKDFSLGSLVGDVASTATTCVVNLNVQPRYLIDIERDPFRSILVMTAGTPYIRKVGGAQVLGFSTTAEAQKVDALSAAGWSPAAKAIVEGIINIATNGDAAAVDINVGVANGTHANDADAITESCFIHVDGGSANINAESDDGTTEVAATDTTVDFTAGTPFHFMMDLRDPADIQIYINGAVVLPSSVFKLNVATGPLKLLAHMEKTADDSPGEVYIDRLRVRIMGE